MSAQSDLRKDRDWWRRRAEERSDYVPRKERDEALRERDEAREQRDIQTQVIHEILECIGYDGDGDPVDAVKAAVSESRERIRLLSERLYKWNDPYPDQLEAERQRKVKR